MEEAKTDILLDLPDTVYQAILDNLPDESIVSISMTDKARNNIIRDIERQDYYWLRKISNALGLEMETIRIPTGISPEVVYSGVYNLERTPYLINWLSGSYTDADLKSLTIEVTSLGLSRLAVFLLDTMARENYMSMLPAPELPDCVVTKYRAVPKHIDLSKAKRKTRIVFPEDARTTPYPEPSKEAFVFQSNDTPHLMERYEIQLFLDSHGAPKVASDVLLFNKAMMSSQVRYTSNGGFYMEIERPSNFVKYWDIIIVTNNTYTRKDTFLRCYTAAAACVAAGVTDITFGTWEGKPIECIMLEVVACWVAGVDTLYVNYAHVLPTLRQNYYKSKTPGDFLRSCSDCITIDQDALEEALK